MTETTTGPEPTEIPALPPPPPPALPPATVRVAKPRPVWPIFFILGFLLLAAGEGFIWHLEQSQTPDAVELAVLRTQMADLQARLAASQPAPESPEIQATLTQKFLDLSAQVNAMQAQMAADHGTLTTLQTNNTDLTKLSARISLLDALASARMALDAGAPLGTIPNAPPALADFATAPPPTEPQLRETFPAAAQKAEAASIAGDATGSYWSRVLVRLENFVTISDRGHVILGAPAAAVLSQAGTLLDAGDLAGAVQQLDTLSLTTQQAMQPWLAEARALLAARAALIAMGGQA